MSAAAILPTQIRQIHAIKTRTRLDEASYRAMLDGYGVSSSKYLTRDDADRLLRRLRDIPGAERPPAERTASAGPYARKLQALWIAGHNLGLVRERSDAAMHAFVARQTGIEHTRFLREARAASAAIQGLKAWLERDGGVDWPARTDDPGLDAMAAKRAVLRAQWRRAAALGLVRLPNPNDPDDGLAEYVALKVRGNSRRFSSIEDATVTSDELDAGSAALGRWLRAGLAEATRRTASGRAR